jgi:hypothetical protein
MRAVGCQEAGPRTMQQGRTAGLRHAPRSPGGGRRRWCLGEHRQDAQSGQEGHGVLRECAGDGKSCPRVGHSQAPECQAQCMTVGIQVQEPVHYNVDCDQEVDTYRTMAGHQFNEGKLDVKANILMWWKLHAVRFPYLSRLARRYLAMPATSVSVERLFSVAGQVVTAKRARLDPSTVTLLVFLHEAIPGGIERESYEIIEASM